MTPGARVAAAIELLQKVERSQSPADDVISAYYRGRRFIGSKDRREISRLVFCALRHHARLNHWTQGGDIRQRMLALLKRVDELSSKEIAGRFNGIGYAPTALTSEETTFIGDLADKKDDTPDWVSAEIPEWLYGELSTAWGENTASEAKALNTPAPLDLRVNTLKADVGRALEVLRNDKIEAEATSLSPIGLRLSGRVNLQATTAFKGGFVEVQDEGSQLIAFLTNAKADQRTIDFCAGGGGKTLALAATMKDGGPLIACDLEAERLNKLAPRLKRAGVSNITRQPLSDLNDPWIAANAGTAERVLLDVPCSGAGAWRRNPAAKWRLTPDRLEAYAKTQQEILQTASLLVAPGGRLIYATCSVLPIENEHQIDAFLSASPGFRLLPVSEVWAETIGGECPCANPYLKLTPHQSGTDGFFAAVMERQT